MARYEACLAKVLPDGGKILFLHAQHVDALAASHLDSRYGELVDNIGNRPQFAGRCHAAPHARDDGVGAILLDVRVNALVDESRLVIVLIVARIIAHEVVVERRSAFGAAARGFPFEFLHDGGNCAQVLRLDQAAHVVMAKVRALAHRLHGGRIVGIAQADLEQLFHQPGARAAGSGSLGMGTHIIQ